MDAKSLLLLALICCSYAVNICDVTVAHYAVYSYGYICNGNEKYISVYNITSTNKVLVKSPSNSYIYVDISLLNVGDTIRTIAGDTIVTSITQSTIAAPEALNSENYIQSRSGPAYKQISSWITLDSASILPYLKPASTGSSNSVTEGDTTIFTFVRNLNEFVINENNVVTATDNYKPQLQVNYGPVECQNNTYDLIYYDTQQLLSNCFGSTFQEIKLTGRLSEFAQMVTSIVSNPNKLAFVNDGTLYDFEYSIPSCNSRIITTANGYITINGLSLKS